MAYIGIDYHKAQFTVCYRSVDGGDCVREFPSTPDGETAFLETVSCFDEVALEAMGMSRVLAKKLQQKVRRFVDVNANGYALITRSIKKTDRHDARMLAYGLEKDILPVARFRSDAAMQLRSLVIARELLIRHRVAFLVHLHNLLSLNGIHIERRVLRARKARLAQPFEDFEIGDRLAYESYCGQLDHLVENVHLLDAEINRCSQQMPGYAILNAIPGFGPITVALLQSNIDGVEHFDSAKALCSFLGIVPRTRLSDGKPAKGDKFGRFKSGSITRAGDTRTRAALVMAVNRTLVHNVSLRAFYDRIKGRKGYRKARTAAARKLLCFIYYALKSGKPVDDFSAVNFARLVEGCQRHLQ
ncbi:IS110 family transposase [Kordiimonas gwangyangensis]|uniref:IS110 family transposase n=1 Tax=Kordiimonas gwangyangensis TaxID=288022 RepID=UPI00037CE98D|nr:IS110 family transposase [Kordiimonas gwangyangensis]